MIIAKAFFQAMTVIGICDNKHFFYKKYCMNVDEYALADISIILFAKPFEISLLYFWKLLSRILEFSIS